MPGSLREGEPRRVIETMPKRREEFLRVIEDAVKAINGNGEQREILIDYGPPVRFI